MRFSRSLPVFLFVAAGLRAQSASAELGGMLDTIVASEMAKQKIPSLAMAAVKDGHIFYAKGFGVTSGDARLPVAPDTLFQAGGMSRLLTTVVAVSLADQGRLRMDAPIGNYLVGLSPEQGNLTVRDVLSDSAGPEADMLGRKLIDVIRSKPLASVMDETVLKPLGMKNTTFDAAMAMTYPVALGHTADGLTVRPMPGDPGASYSSVSDFGRFMNAFLNEGKLSNLPDAEVLLAPAAIAELTTGGELTSDASRGTRLLAHAASITGYENAILMAPEFKTGVIVMANRSGADTKIIARKLLEALLPVRFPPAPAP